MRQSSSATINIPPTNPAKVDALDVSAIDSKIEQAMDLVKSHVTFAVRQEVEELKTTITTLQAKVGFNIFSKLYVYIFKYLFNISGCNVRK